MEHIPTKKDKNSLLLSDLAHDVYQRYLSATKKRKRQRRDITISIASTKKISFLNDDHNGIEKELSYQKQNSHRVLLKDFASHSPTGTRNLVGKELPRRKLPVRRDLAKELSSESHDSCTKGGDNYVEQRVGTGGLNGSNNQSILRKNPIKRNLLKSFAQGDTDNMDCKDVVTGDGNVENCTDYSSDFSIDADCGDWGDDHTVPWKGCICGVIHPRPIHVFWIQCDECRSWYNVASECIGFDSKQAETCISTWSCHTCSKKVSAQLRLFLELPDVLLHKILTFTAKPIDKVVVLCRQIAPLCSLTQRVVHGKRWSGLWSSLRRQDYNFNKMTGRNSSDSTLTDCNSRNRCRHLQRQQRCSLNRRRKKSEREQVIDTYLSLISRTDDAHMALAEVSNSENTPLTLKRLRCIMGSSHGNNYSNLPLLIDRRSPCGRTFVQVCCAADYVDERVVLRCVKELVENYGANVDVFTTDEYPIANRPALFFAISRAMPSVVEYLVEKGNASTEIIVEGRFRSISDPSEGFYGSFNTPLAFAKKLKDVELSRRRIMTKKKASSSSSRSSRNNSYLSPYWMNKLNGCIRILSRSNIEKKRKYET